MDDSALEDDFRVLDERAGGRDEADRVSRAFNRRHRVRRGGVRTPAQPPASAGLGLGGQPALLTGGGHLAPVPSVLRFIDRLVDAGVTGIVRPA